MHRDHEDRKGNLENLENEGLRVQSGHLDHRYSFFNCVKISYRRRSLLIVTNAKLHAKYENKIDLAITERRKITRSAKSWKQV